MTKNNKKKKGLKENFFIFYTIQKGVKTKKNWKKGKIVFEIVRIVILFIEISNYSKINYEKTILVLKESERIKKLEK